MHDHIILYNNLYEYVVFLSREVLFLSLNLREKVITANKIEVIIILSFSV